MKNIMNIAIAIILGILVFALVALICALPVMLLWNWLMPDIFGLTTINFWQALGISFLSSCLFGRTSSNKKKED